MCVGAIGRFSVGFWDGLINLYTSQRRFHHAVRRAGLEFFGQFGVLEKVFAFMAAQQINRFLVGWANEKRSMRKAEA